MSTSKKYYTWLEIRQKISRDLDIEEETFVRPEELVEYANEAIQQYESEVNTNSSTAIDYFLQKQTINLVAGVDEYSLPDEIYGHKIRKIMFNNTSSVYEVKRAKHKKFEKKVIADNFNTSDLYEYFIENSSVADPKIVLIPKARDTGPYLQIWFLRNLNRMTGDDADICDIPFGINFIFQYIKVRVYEKEGHPNLTFAAAAFQRETELLRSMFADPQPDGNDEIEMDLSYYEELN